MEGIKENWTEIKEIIKREYKLTEISYRTWVEPLQFYKVANSVVSIIIPAELSHMLDYISSKYKNFFQVIISEMFDHVYQVQFILEQDVVPLSEEEKDSEELSEKENLNPKYKFSTFVVGSSNKLAHSQWRNLPDRLIIRSIYTEDRALARHT